MATTNTTLYKIELPNLSSNSFGSDLRQAFENIDSNFQKLSTLGLTTGEAGAPAIWVPFNLNCVFKGFDPNDDSFIKYQEIINGGEDAYQETCFELYKLLLEALPDDTQQVGIYKHKWEYDYTPFSDRNTPYDDKYDPYLPGILLIAGNIDVDDSGNHSFRMLGSTAHIYMDPRFRAQLQHTPMSEDIINQMAQATDQSCVLYGKAVDITEQNPLGFEFEYVYAFPRIYCGPDGNFYLNINNINTNIPLNGRAGAAGKDANIVAVHLSDDISPAVIDDILYNNDDSQNGQNLEVTSFVGTNTAISSDDAPNLDGCPALIFPPKGYGRYGSFYWVGYLSYGGSGLTAYCGRENLITTDIYEHNFGGMMMGLDMYEVAKARPAGNAPWYKPRGLMLPIGTRAYGDYWDPRDDTGDQPNISQFGAHLIYSRKDASNLKKEIHLSSVQDYRSIGSTLDGQAQPDYTQNINRVDGTVFVIDEPVKITNYGDESSLYNGNILTAFGSSLIKGNEHIDGNLSVGADGVNGNVTANKYTRRGHESGQLLLASGDSTSSAPIRIKVGNGDPVPFNFQPISDGGHYYSADITSLIPDTQAADLNWDFYQTYETYFQDTYTFQYRTLTYDGNNRLVVVHIDVHLGGNDGVRYSEKYTGPRKRIAELSNFSDVAPPYKIWNFIGSINHNHDIGDDDAQIGIWFSLSDEGLWVEKCNWPQYMGINDFSMDFIYPLSGQIITYYWALSNAPNNGANIGTGQTSIPSAPSGATTWYLVSASKEYTGLTPDSPTTYNDGGWRWSCTAQQSNHIYYWKTYTKPQDNASLVNPTASSGNVNSNWYIDDKGWYLVKLITTLSSAPTTAVYNAAGTGEWSYDYIKPTLVTYQWKQTDNNYNIINYLAQTQLAVVKDNTASGPIIDILRSNNAAYERYDGPHGTVSITKTNAETHITVEAWDYDWGHINCNSYNVIVTEAQGNNPENISFDAEQQTITVTLKSN